MHGDGFLRANAGLATAVLGGPTFPITECNKGNKGTYRRYAGTADAKALVTPSKQKRKAELWSSRHLDEYGTNYI